MLLSSSIILNMTASTPQPPVIIAVPPSGEFRQARPLIAPTADGIARSLEGQLNNPGLVVERGLTRLPSVDVSDAKCRPPERSLFTCEFRYRIKRYGESDFGPWFARKGSFAYLDQSWSEIIDRRLCHERTLTTLPRYCSAQ